MANPLRTLIQKLGIDVHRYRPKPEPLVWLASLNIKTVFDIGANTGQFAAEIQSQLPHVRLFSFEPLTDCYEILRKRFSADSQFSFSAFNYALGEKTEKKIIHRSAYTPSSSLLRMTPIHQRLFPHTAKHQSEQITVKRLDDIAPTLDWQPELLIKVDVQGYEDRVLAGGQKTFGQARGVIMEISFKEFYQGQPTFDHLYNQLKRLGFTYQGSLAKKSDPQTGATLSEDILFIR